MQHQPRAGDGRILGSPDSKEPKPELLDNGEPLPLDEKAVAKFQQRLEQRTKHRQTQDDSQHQPRAGNGRKLGSPDSQEPDSRLLPSGEPEPFDEEAVARHQQRLEQKVRATIVVVVPMTSICNTALGTCVLVQR